MMEERGDKAAAIECFKRALELDPENPRVQQALKRLESGQ
jgi:Flp pilus assembly protein TadD